MRQRLRSIIRKEFLQAFRDPRSRGMLIFPPLIQLLIFGYAVNLDVDSARIAWMDLDRTPASRELLSDFEGSGRFALAGVPTTEGEMQSMLDRGQVDGVIRVLPGFGRDVARGRATGVQVLLDGTNSNSASLISGYATQVIARYSLQASGEVQRARLVAGTTASGGPMSIPVPQLTARTRVWYNPDLRSRNYFIPGVVVNIITLVTLSLTAMAIVREKEIGTMEQLMVTPIRPLELILGKTLPFLVVGYWDLVLVVVVARVLFRVPFNGSFLLLLFAAFVFLLTTLGAGLFLSTISRTQQQAMMGTSLFFQPFFLLSGFSFPIRNMPEAVQWLTYLNPVRYFMEIVRGVFLQGAGLNTLWPQVTALAVFGVVILSLSVQRFHKQLE
ncbi:MAG TPA: ABC transporter permease [Bryobacteraceae bacterium]|jgi:ABC-2 type transport system permease protein|nr:ABC transporter permease [Bryobacteraceae bacterium]